MQVMENAVRMCLIDIHSVVLT